MTVQMWVGSPLIDDVVTLFEAAELSVPRDLVWFSDAQCGCAYRTGSTMPQSHSAASPSHEAVRAFLQSHNNDNVEASCECLAASLGTLEGQGRLLDALRQRQPQQLVVWLPAPGDRVNAASATTISLPDV